MVSQWTIKLEEAVVLVVQISQLTRLCLQRNPWSTKRRMTFPGKLGSTRYYYITYAALKLSAKSECGPCSIWNTCVLAEETRSPCNQSDAKKILCCMFSRAEHRYLFLRVMFRFSIAFFAFPLVIASILQQSLQNRWPQLRGYLCEKVELSVTYQICSFLFSAHFVETMSKALQIPKWRIFNIWTEEGDEEGCLIVKFGIIGTGNPALSRQLHCGLPLLWSFMEYQTGKHVTSRSSDRVTVQYYSRAFPCALFI